MHYLKWTETDITNLGFAALFTEVNDHGVVTRELGIDRMGRVVHKAPTQRDNYGVFHNIRIDLHGLSDDLPPSAFNILWEFEYGDNVSGVCCNKKRSA